MLAIAIRHRAALGGVLVLLGLASFLYVGYPRSAASVGQQEVGSNALLPFTEPNLW